MTAVAAVPAPAFRERSVVLRLARIEATRMVLNPAFLAGFVGSAVVAWRAVVTDAEAPWPAAGYQTAFIAWAFAGLGTLLAAALAAGRGRLLADVELFPGVPLAPSRRVLALVLALAGPVGLVAAAVAVEAAMVADRGGFRQADPPWSTGLVPVPILEWVHLPLAVLLGGITGIVVATLPRARAVALAVVTAVGLLSSVVYWAFTAVPLRAIHPLMFGTSAERLPAGFRPSSWDGERGLLPPDRYEPRWREVRVHETLLQWHVVGLIALCVAGTGLAMWLADRDERRSLPVAGTGLLVALVAIGAQIAVGV